MVSLFRSGLVLVVWTAPAAQKQHGDALVQTAQVLFARERARVDRTVEAFMVHKVQYMPEVYWTLLN